MIDDRSLLLDHIFDDAATAHPVLVNGSVFHNASLVATGATPIIPGLSLDEVLSRSFENEIIITEQICKLHRELDATKLAIAPQKDTIDTLVGRETLVAHQMHALSQRIENLKLANGMLPLYTLSSFT